MTISQTKAFIKRQIKRWEYLVTSYGWKFEVLYCDNISQMPEGYQIETAACTTSKPQYLTGSISFCLPAMAEYDADEIEEIVIHEITHMLLSAMWQAQNDESHELVTTMVSRLFKGLRK